MTSLFEPVSVGDMLLPNRVSMSPMTRNRSYLDVAAAAEYYAQRAEIGLIVSEAVSPSLEGVGSPNAPELHTDAHESRWRGVSDAVHDAGGRIFLQLMHAGRYGHPDNKEGARTVAPSAIATPDAVFTPGGMKPAPVPHALSASEIAAVVEDFAAAARRAMSAGADGVEIHAANGFLVHEFLSPSSNTRADRYGGSPADRARFGVEVLEAVVDAIGREHVGIRISPRHNILGVIEDDDADTRRTYSTLVSAASNLGIAYLSYLADPRAELTKMIRSEFSGPTIGNAGFGAVPTSLSQAEEIVARGWADLAGVGRLALANPDLVTRWRRGAPLNEPDPSTFYGGSTVGYTDYPPLAA